MLAGIVGSNIGSPGHWHKDFKVGLGLDLSSGTQATLRAVTQKGQDPPSADMKEAVAIINDRVNASGNTGVSVQQQGATDIQVTAPGQGSQQLINNVDTTAQLRFRAVLLEGSSAATATPSTSPSPGASSSASPSASTSSSAKAKAKSSASPSASTKAYIQPAAATPSPSAQASTGSSAKASSTASPSASASASPSATGSAATATTAGNPAAVSKAAMALFNKLDCSNINNWKTKLKYSEPQWDNPNSQTVACDKSGTKYVLDKAVILGTDVTGESSGIDTTSNQPVVNLTLNHKATTAFGKLTSTQATKYYPGVSSGNANDSVLDQTAIVLDGNVVSAPQTTEAIPAGQVQITGLGSQTAADQLAEQLKFGALPLTFKVVDVENVSPSLGRSQLDAGLIAGGIGLILVVIYSFFYYRGLGSVSVSSLIIAGLVGYLAVVLLSRYQGFTLSLTGIAGLIVAIGITADSFVVFFERLRDEVREGRTLRAAVESGWKRARRTILVSDTVSFLAALLLYIFSVGDVKGFAYTLGLTTLIDVVVVFLFTKPMVTLLARTRFFGQGHRWSGLDPARLGARAPWRSGLPRRTERTPRTRE